MHNQIRTTMSFIQSIVAAKILPGVFNTPVLANDEYSCIRKHISAPSGKTSCGGGSTRNLFEAHKIGVDQIKVEEEVERMEGTYVGETMVPHKEAGMSEKVIVTKCKTRKNDIGTDFIIYLPKSNGRFLELGHLSFHFSTNGESGPYIHIDTMDTRKGNEHFKYLGLKLHQIAIEAALCNGLEMVNLKSDDIGGGNPTLFHFKSGYRTGLQYRDALLLEAQRNGDKNPPIGIGSLMHLSKESFVEWLKTISESPILANYDPLGELRAKNEKAWINEIEHIVLTRGINLPGDVIREAAECAKKYPSARYIEIAEELDKLVEKK